MTEPIYNTAGIPVLPNASSTSALPLSFPIFHSGWSGLASQEGHCNDTSAGVSVSLFHVNISLNSLSKHRVMFELLKQSQPWLTGNQTSANLCTSVNMDMAGGDEKMT